MIIKGRLISCKREVKEFDKKRKTEEKLFLTLADAEISEEQMQQLQDAFANSGAKFTPDWVKNFEGYVNLSTKFDLPYRWIDKVEHLSIEDGIAEGLKWMGAEVKVSLNIKEGAIYPNALLFVTEGSAINAFAEFDNEE